MAKKYCYLFTEGNANMRELLGGKGANLAEMTNIGLPVPQGFTITTEACTKYYEDGKKINDEIKGQIMDYIGADRGYVMRNGRIHCSGRPGDLLKEIRENGYGECDTCQPIINL